MLRSFFSIGSSSIRKAMDQLLDERHKQNFWVPAGKWAEAGEKEGRVLHVSEAKKVKQSCEISGGVATGYFYRWAVESV